MQGLSPGGPLTPNNGAWPSCRLLKTREKRLPESLQIHRDCDEWREAQGSYDSELSCTLTGAPQTQMHLDMPDHA